MNDHVRQFTVDAEDDGIRLDRWFKRHLPDASFNTVSRWARTGQLRVDGKLLFTPAANANGAGYASLAFQVQVNTGSIGSISAFSSVRQAGNCGSMSNETCFAAYLTDQYIRWLKSSSLGDDAGNCWRASMARAC